MDKMAEHFAYMKLYKALDAYDAETKAAALPQPVLAWPSKLDIANCEVDRWKGAATYLQQELDRVTAARDMLAAQVRALLRERAMERAAMIMAEPTPTPDPIHNAIAVHQKQGVR